MAVWFEGSGEIACSIGDVATALDGGSLHVGITGLMPGITSAELLDQGPDSVTIRTNEGLMKRTNIATRATEQGIVVEFDEEYQAGTKLTTNSHFMQEFTTSPTGVTHHLTMSDVQAPGLMGSLYRRLGSSSIGRAFLAAHKEYLETAPG